MSSLAGKLFALVTHSFHFELLCNTCPTPPQPLPHILAGAEHQQRVQRTRNVNMPHPTPAPAPHPGSCGTSTTCATNGERHTAVYAACANYTTLITLHYTTTTTTLPYTRPHYTIPHDTTLHDITLHYTTLITPQHGYNCNCTCKYTNYTTLQLLYSSTTLHNNCSYNCNYNYNCTTPH